MPDKDPIEAPVWSVNPIALAELITGHGLMADKEPADWVRVQALLREAFQTEDLASIFEAEGGAAPRLDLFQKLADTLSGQAPQELATILQNPLVDEAIKKKLYSEEAMRRVLPYLVPLIYAVVSPPGAPAPHGATPDSEWKPFTYVVDDVSYLDPEQGGARDCFLISAMIALAWSRRSEWIKRVKETMAYSYAFYHGPATRDAPVKPEAELLRNLTLGKFAFARSSTSASEGWPGMFEKAYVMRECGLHDGNPLHKDYLTLRQRWPYESCRMLAGGAPHQKLVDRYEVVRARCGFPEHTHGMCKEPTMAWTNKDAGLNDGLRWNQTGLNRNHAYAVLGTMKSDEKTFVVLRNPWGDLRPAKSTAGLLVDGTWKPSGAEEVRLGEKGVFALLDDWFDRCIYSVDWVTP